MVECSIVEITDSVGCFIVVSNRLLLVVFLGLLVAHLRTPRPSEPRERIEVVFFEWHGLVHQNRTAARAADSRGAHKPPVTLFVALRSWDRILVPPDRDHPVIEQFDRVLQIVDRQSDRGAGVVAQNGTSSGSVDSMGSGVAPSVGDWISPSG